MKKNLLMLALCLMTGMNAFSQTSMPPTNAEISTGYYDRMNYIFGALELN